MDRYACGDDSAFSELYDLLAPRLSSFAMRRTRDEGATEDLVQQTFLQMHCARRHFAPGAAVTPWAFAIARRLLIDSARRVGHSHVPVSDVDPAALLEEQPSLEPSPASCASARRFLQRVEEELERVPQAHREAFALVKLDGISLAEAAQILGTTVMAVKLRVHRAVAALEERLGPEVREEFAEWA